jgi:hypothetical protein
LVFSQHALILRDCLLSLLQICAYLGRVIKACINRIGDVLLVGCKRGVLIVTEARINRSGFFCPLHSSFMEFVFGIPVSGPDPMNPYVWSIYVSAPLFCLPVNLSDMTEGG